MSFYKWDENLATGIGDIDVQHQMIFVILNNFIEDCLNGKSNEAVRPVLDFLADYVVKHFLIEERYMATYSYPEYPSHKSQHSQFQRQAAMQRRADDAVDHLDVNPVDKQRRPPEFGERRSP